MKTKKSNEKYPWDDKKKKKEAYMAVVDSIANAPDDFINHDDAIRAAFGETMDIPKDVRLVVLRNDDVELKGGSIVIQAPTKGAQLSEDQKIELFLCSYPTFW